MNSFNTHASASRSVAALAALLALFAVSPHAFALTPGPTIIRQCPGCTNALAQFTIGSGNLLRAEFWTDGFRRAPMWPMLPALVKCPHCQKLFWIEDAKELAQRMGSGGERDPWRNAKEPLEPAESDYLAAAGAANISRAHELYARQRAWWLANDPARADPKQKVEWTEARKKNLTRLAALLDESKDGELIAKAEIARELGDFDRCLQLLGRSVDKQWADTANLVARLAREKQAQVAKLP